MNIAEPLFLIAVFVLGLFTMVTIHEFGHFLACRRSGIIVEEFSIGMFGPRLLSTKRGDTIYAFRPVLIGAFVKPIGESDPDVPGGLAGQRAWVRMKVYAAGPLANIVLAFVVLTGFFALKNETSWVEGNGLMIQEVEEDSAAAKAGIQPGDILLEADGKAIHKEQDLADVINSNAKDSNVLLVERSGQTSEVVVEPEYEKKYHRKLIGVFLCWGMVTQVDETSPADPPIKPGDTILNINGEAVYSEESFSDALRSAKEGDKIEVMLIQGEDVVDSSFVLASQDPVQAIGVQNRWVEDTYIETKHYSVWESPARAGGYMFVDLPRDMRTAMTTVVKDDPSKAFVGPVGAGQLAVETVQSFGFGHFLFLAGLISIGLALFNFIPVPPLDGGGMLVALIEGIRRGKRLSTKATQLVYTVGTALMLTLFVLIMYSDIVRLIKGENFLR